MERKEVSDFKRKILKIKKKSYLFICVLYLFPQNIVKVKQN